jgi:hypothetical protein
MIDLDLKCPPGKPETLKKTKLKTEKDKGKILKTPKATWSTEDFTAPARLDHRDRLL